MIACPASFAMMTFTDGPFLYFLSSQAFYHRLAAVFRCANGAHRQHTRKRSGKGTGNGATHKSSAVPELDLESLQPTTAQEASASSSAEGPVLPKDNVLATLSARFSRNWAKNKLQPNASRRAVRVVCQVTVYL